MKVEAKFSPWEAQLRTLVREEIRKEIIRITGSPDFQLMWSRRPHDYVEGQIEKALDDAWSIFPDWSTTSNAISTKGKLHEVWSILSPEEKSKIAKSFTVFFYACPQPRRINGVNVVA